ncbi:MAG: hypothetical protein AAB652_00220 [Patescibacteria group bacterium]
MRIVSSKNDYTLDPKNVTLQDFEMADHVEFSFSLTEFDFVSHSFHLTLLIWPDSDVAEEIEIQQRLALKDIPPCAIDIQDIFFNDGSDTLEEVCLSGFEKILAKEGRLVLSQKEGVLVIKINIGTFEEDGAYVVAEGTALEKLFNFPISSE